MVDHGGKGFTSGRASTRCIVVAAASLGDLRRRRLPTPRSGRRCRLAQIVPATVATLALPLILTPGQRLRWLKPVFPAMMPRRMAF